MKFKTDIIIDGFALAKLFKVELTANQSVGPGEIAWNPLDGTFDLGLLNGVKLQSGQELHFYGKATETISSGDAVMFAGVQGDHILIAKADRSVINGNPNYFIGIATQNFMVNEFGYVTSFGKVRELDTSSYTLGSVLYFDSESSTPGLLTSTMPNANQAKIEVAAVVSVHSNQGILMVRTHIMPMLNEIQDVDLTLSKTTPLNADNILIQDSEDQSIWKKLSWGNTKATLKTYFDSLYQKGSGTTNYVAKFTNPTSLGDSQIFDNGTNVGIGTANPNSYPYGEKLNVNGNISIGGTKIGFGTTDSFVAYGWYSAAHYGISWAGDNPLALSGYYGLGFFTNGSEKMRVTYDGKVGIGTTSPEVSLDVFGINGGTAQIRVRSTIGGDIRMSVDTVGRLGTYSNSDLLMLTNGSEKMRITSQGYMLLGTGFAQYGNANRGTFEINGSSDNIFVMKVNNSLAGYLYASSSFTELYSTNHILFSTFGNVRMRITDSGNVGIGPSDPDASAALDVSSTTQGFLPPRMNDSEMNSISSPVDGLMIFNTDVSSICVYISSAGAWKILTYA